MTGEQGKPDAPPMARPVRRRRRWPAALGAVVLAAVAAGLGLQSLRGSAAKKPAWNVLLITFDTTRSDRLSCYGYEHIDTPTIDLMAQHGLRYERCYAPATVTLPSHASILTGLYPFHHGLRSNGVGPLDGSIVTLAEILKQHGYRTGAVIGASVLEAQYGLDQGFEFYDSEFSLDTRSRFNYASRRAAEVTDTAVQWLETIGDAQFFLWVHYYDPHAPYAPPGYDPASAIGIPYDLEIAYADHELDRLLAFAGQLKHATQRPTLIVFAADHGEALWDHGEPTHGFFVYNECVRVPLIVHLPQERPLTGVIETPVSLVDIFPSILAWLGIPLRHEVHGRVLPTDPRDQESAQAASRPLYFEAYMPYAAYGWSPLAGVVIGEKKFISGPRPEFYDLTNDPREAANLYAEADPHLARFAHALQEVKAARLGAPAPQSARPVQDAESIRKLLALGYVAGFEAEDLPRDDLPDPKDRIGLHCSVTQAQSEIENGAFENALRVLQGVLAEEPLNPRATFLLADLLVEQSISDQAIQIALQHVDQPHHSPFNVLLPTRLGIALAQQGQHERAITYLRRAVAADPDNAEANYSLGQVLAARDEKDASLRCLHKAVELDPQDPRYVLAVARTHERFGELEQATHAYDRVLELDEDNLIALNNSAWVCCQLRQRPDVALARSRRAVALQPRDPRLYHTLGAILVWQERAAEAVEHLKQAVAMYPAYGAAHYQLGLAWQLLGDDAKATAAFEKAIQHAGDPPPAWLSDARARFQQLSPP